ncbi:MAG: tRNA dimethylallyltransferase [Candidatus Azambacteria bacterium GW2011_GWA2_42_9]|uniref:tRNA dimethylallyltransferase n=1 Tax=Candidatus Azambacteria bacterium GW2011_GWA2_42_9 TaxID=1618613 RepID=A0A0G1BQC4_9BACT|nr:MAG: tRNA dimethylallyltransferase [Candidatus Azambacteria bacterium GW2011_GWA2_42_9]
MAKVIVIVGPTASGKSALAIYLAKKLGAEIISADSRQVYRGMDIGTGKVTKTEQKQIKHWLIDIVSPKTNFSAAQFKKLADKKIEDILKLGKLPIIVGGTGFWIKAVIDNVEFPKVKPDWKLRKKLDRKSADALFTMLQNLDLDRAAEIDQFNKVRLIRAIEIAKTLGKVPKMKMGSKYNTLQLGVSWPKEILSQRIKIRLDKRFKQGMIKEVAQLHNQGISWQRLDNFGLEYRWIARYLRGKMPLKEMKEKLFQEIKNYAKRQMTWFNKDKRICWQVGENEVEKLIKKFLVLLFAFYFLPSNFLFFWS